VAGNNINSSSALRGMDGLVDVNQTSTRLRQRLIEIAIGLAGGDLAGSRLE